MFRRTLSAKLAFYIIIVAFMLASTFSMFTIISEYKGFKEQIYSSVNELMQSTRSTASEAVFKLDSSIAQTLVDGIVANKYIIMSTLYDENETVLATQYEESPKDVWRPFNLKNETISIEIPVSNQSAVGRHSIVLDMESNLAEFYERVIKTVIIEFFEMIAIAFCVYLISVKLIARPVESLSRIVAQIPVGEKAPDIKLTQQEDEIGLLARNTVTFINKSYVFAQELETKQQERLELEEQLRHSQKMDAIGQLAGGVAHDFNNIMTVVLGNVTLAEIYLDTCNEEKMQKSLKAIKESAERATKLTKQLLIFSRKDLIKPKLVDICASVSEASKMIKQLVPETFHINYDLEQVGPVYTDKSQVELILINLVVNAKDALSENGHINITCSDQVLDEEFVKQHPSASVGEYVLLTVSDTGKGISEECLLRIFEPFYTTKEVGKGTGLGLSTVYSIVDNWKGFILVDSTVDKGTSFNVYLPHSSDQFIEEDVIPQKTITTEKLNATVLICEDDHDVRELTVELLSDSGLTIHQAEDPKSAIELCKDIGNDIDLLITDVIMPEMNGKELSEKLSKQYTFKTIFVSGYSANFIADKGIIGDDLLFIQKPFTKETLLRTISTAIGKESE